MLPVWFRVLLLGLCIGLGALVVRGTTSALTRAFHGQQVRTAALPDNDADRAVRPTR